MPNGNRRKQKRPLGVMKVVTLELFGRRGICQKVNHLARLILKIPWLRLFWSDVLQGG